MTVEWCGPGWLRPFYEGREDSIFHRVTAVQLAAREVPDAVLELKYLKSLNLKTCRVSGEQLRRLHRLDSLSLTQHESRVITDR